MNISLRQTAATLLCVLLCVATASALTQKKRKSARGKKARVTSRPTPTPTPPPVSFSAEAAQVAEQLKIVSRFVYVYGKVANGLELAEEQARRGELSQAALAQNRQARETVAANISNVRVGLDALTSRFRANPRLQVHYLKLSYATDAAAQAEKLVASGRFDEAGKSLVTAVERLTDALVALR